MHKLRRGLFSLTVLIILLTGYNFICRAEESAEKGPAEIGDILYNSFGGDWKPGHTMLYVGWYPDKEPKKENLRVVESLPDMFVKESLRNRYSYDHARTWKQELSAEQRRKISEFVITKIGVWKHCEDLDHTYQKGQDGIHCDCVGLCEAAYESIGLNPVWMEWPILWPEQQCNSSRMKDATPVLPEIRLEPSEEGTLKAYASDGDDGSGITMVEFWNGKPDDTPESTEGTGIRLGWDNRDADVDDYYTYYYGGTVTHLYAKAFDQAGNTKITGRLEDNMVCTYQPDSTFWPTDYTIHEYTVSYAAEEGETTTKHRIYYTYPAGYDTLYITNHYAGSGAGFAPNYQNYPFLYLEVYEVDTSAFNIKTITWNTQPALGRLIEIVELPTGWANAYREFSINITGTTGICIRTRAESSMPPNTWQWAKLFSTHGDGSYCPDIPGHGLPHIEKNSH